VKNWKEERLKKKICLKNLMKSQALPSKTIPSLFSKTGALEILKFLTMSTSKLEQIAGTLLVA